MQNLYPSVVKFSVSMSSNDCFNRYRDGTPTARRRSMKRNGNNRSVRSIGYLDQKSTLEAIDTEERLAVVYGRVCGDLKYVEKFVNLFKQGDVLSVTLRKRSFRGTLLGYKKKPRRGWVAGVLECKTGIVKEITIDMNGYEQAGVRGEEDKPILEYMVDMASKYFSLVTDYEAILQISPAAA